MFVAIRRSLSYNDDDDNNNNNKDGRTTDLRTSALVFGNYGFKQSTYLFIQTRQKGPQRLMNSKRKNSERTENNRKHWSCVEQVKNQEHTHTIYYNRNPPYHHGCSTTIPHIVTKRFGHGTQALLQQLENFDSIFKNNYFP